MKSVPAREGRFACHLGWRCKPVRRAMDTSTIRFSLHVPAFAPAGTWARMKPWRPDLKSMIGRRECP